MQKRSRLEHPSTRREGGTDPADREAQALVAQIPAAPDRGPDCHDNVEVESGPTRQQRKREPVAN